MARYDLYHAGDKPTNNPLFDMWPAVEIDENSKVGPSAAHRGHTSHQAISRCIDFRAVKDSGPRDSWANQDALRRWYMERVNPDMQVDDVLSLVVIPAGEDWKTTYWKLCSPVEGLTVDIIEVLSDTVIEAGLDLGAEGLMGLKPVADDDRMKPENRIIGIKIKAMPTSQGTLCTPAPKALEGLCFCVSAEVVVPWTGK